MTASVLPGRSAQALEGAPSLRIERFRPRLGALVSGVDLSRPLDEATRHGLQAAFVEHGVLFFRDQTFDPGRFLEVARLFGEPYKQNEYSHGLPGYPAIRRSRCSKTARSASRRPTYGTPT